MNGDQKKVSIMALLVIAFLSFSFYIYTALPVPPAPVAARVMKGKALWQQKNCNSCHQVYGLGGYLGPDLTHAYSDRGPEYIRAFINSGTDIMPNFQLSPKEVDALIAYLQSLDASGNGRPASFKPTIYGTVDQ